MGEEREKERLREICCFLSGLNTRAGPVWSRVGWQGGRVPSLCGWQGPKPFPGRIQGDGSEAEHPRHTRLQSVLQYGMLVFQVAALSEYR